MKFEVKKVFVFLPLIAALAACGGGGSDGDTAVNANVGTGTTGTTGGSAGGSTGTTTGGGSTGTSTSSVTAFAPGTSPRYVVMSTALQGAGRLQAVDQQANGGVVALNGNVLAGADRVVADITGDASVALGRWTKGTATLGSTTTTLGATVYSNVHYIAYNALDAFPTSGAYTCDAGKFTSPTLVEDPNTPEIGTARGSAALSYTASGAVVDASITVDLGNGKTGTVSATGRTLSSPTTSLYTGSLLSSGMQGLMLSTAKGTGARHRVIVGYVAVADGTRYRGIATFDCAAQ
ncbi:hypothetical protein ACQ86G_15735 [Roseateles chitinivorans]|uniref:hypothetical protein n=1 Tax=Roseateles chitinivorans TaxID=2917965 RepID=UPI003D66C827